MARLVQPYLSAVSASKSSPPSALSIARARPAADDSDADHIAVGEPGRRLDPTRLAEAAGRFPHAIVGEDIVRIRALEGHDLEGRLGLEAIGYPSQAMANTSGHDPTRHLASLVIRTPPKTPACHLVVGTAKSDGTNDLSPF
jgi:hypothetical protein